MENGSDDRDESYDIGGIISVLFAAAIIIIILASAFGYATISGSLARIIDILIGFLIGRFTTVN